MKHFSDTAVSTVKGDESANVELPLFLVTHWLQERQQILAEQRALWEKNIKQAATIAELQVLSSIPSFAFTPRFQSCQQCLPLSRDTPVMPWMRRPAPRKDLAFMAVLVCPLPTITIEQH